jgi:hypothetical protein
MIQLTLPPEPPKLTANKKKLTEAYAASCRAGKPKAVWNTKYIRDALLVMTHGKCAYSEVLLQGRGAYWDVEHFKCKDLYPGSVVEWGNLLPACEFCNCSAKREHDVVAVPIVNPIKDRPGEHLYVCSGRFFPNDDKGKNTIEVLRLNDEVNLLCSRFKVCQYCEERLLDCKYWMRKCVEPEDYCKVARLFTAVLRGGLPDQEYSATVATFLMCEQRDLVEEIEQQLGEWKLWDEEMESTKAILLKNALPK